MASPRVTILIPNYKTLQLTKLCLRLIRKFTSRDLAHVIVIDNDSKDASTDYLKTLSWIELIERKAIPHETPGMAHAKALDLGLANTTTPYVLSIHTDTLVKNQEWLPFLLREIESNPKIAGVGSWKLESKPLLNNILKSLERMIQRPYYHLMGKKNHALEGIDHNHYYLRSHCALYRKDAIMDCETSFSDGEEVAGKVMHRKLIAKGYDMVFLPSSKLLQYMDHINHATTVLNPELSRNEKSISKGTKRIAKALDAFNAPTILQDTSLDK